MDTPKAILKIIVALLVPCLMLESAGAQNFMTPRAPSVSASAHFEREAMSAVLLNVRRPVLFRNPVPVSTWVLAAAFLGITLGGAWPATAQTAPESNLSQAAGLKSG